MNSPNKYNNPFLFHIKKKKSLLLLMLFWFCETSGYSQKIDPNGYNKFYFPSGELASEGAFMNGLPTGLWTSYYQDGTIKSKGYKNAGQSDSTWQFFDNAGRLVWLYQYNGGLKNGCAQRFDSLGYLAEEFYYVNDTIHGEKQIFYPDGSIKKQVYYSNGKESGPAFEYAPNGLIITEEIYDNGFLKEKQTFNRLDENGNKTGVWREYHPNGKIKAETTYKDGQKYGLSKNYNEKGKLIQIQEMTSDTTSAQGEVVLIELYKTYYPSGKIRLIGGNNQGQKSGIFREYDENGELINGYIYQNDTLVAEGMILFDGTYDGIWKDYYANGKIQATGSYKNGIKDDIWVYYYPNGKKEQEGKYKNNQPFGVWVWYYPNGQVKRRENFNPYGKLEGNVVEYDSTGQEIASGEYYNGMQEGSWFYRVGDHTEEGSFAQGYPDGLWKHYYLNGKLAFTGFYDQGEPKGKHQWYHTNGIRKMNGKYVGGVKHGVWRTYDKMGEETEEILYKNGEIIKINGFKVNPAE